MGKGKKRKAPMAPQEHKREEPANLFERISNKKRFNILGRKVKGDVRQTGKLRSAATERVSLGSSGGGGTSACLGLPPAF